MCIQFNLFNNIYIKIQQIYRNAIRYAASIDI